MIQSNSIGNRDTQHFDSQYEKTMSHTDYES